MATPKKKAPAKQAPAKKSASKKSNDTGETEYFMKNGKAYARVQSGDVFGPYSANSAAGRTARGGGSGASRSSSGNMGRGNMGGGLRKQGK